MQNWFSVVHGDSEIEQGDLLPSLPFFVPDQDSDWPDDEETPPAFLASSAGAIVLTQSCQTARANESSGVPLVTIAKVFELDSIANLRSAFAREDVRLCRSTAFFMLAEIEPNSDENFGELMPEAFARPRSVVSLDDYQRVPRKWLENWLLQVGARLRLKSPMRESLGASFGASFSRVAIDDRFEIPSYRRQEKDKSPVDQVKGLFRALNADQRRQFLDSHFEESSKAHGLRQANAQLTEKLLAVREDNATLNAELRQRGEPGTGV